jgi:Flp pilus assembly pilin Flp
MNKSPFLRDEQGQAVIEYILMLAIVVSLVGVMGVGFRRGLIQLWEKMAKDISAPCPGCVPPPEVRFR